MVGLTIDGMKTMVPEGTTVLEAARGIGIAIPTLCYDPALTPYGACRLCIVEVAKGNGSSLDASCTLPVREGQVIFTNSERIKNARKIIIELLLATCPTSKKLQDLASNFGVNKIRFKIKDKDCILCGLCVRVCSEVIGQSAVGYANRGGRRVIATPFGTRSEDCIGCGACVFVCPTGALTCEDIDGKRVLKELKTEVPMVACRSCGDYFAPVEQVARLRERLDLPDELAETCPRCRGDEFRVKLEEHIFSKRAAAPEAAAGLVPALLKDKE